MSVLGKSQSPVVMPSYPHFLAADTDVWTRYLGNPIVPIKEVWYDVHVGGAVKLLPGADEMDKRIAAGVTRKRIDVVAKVGAGFWIIEVKPVAGMTAIGQIIIYTRLFVQEFQVTGEVFPVIVADQVDQDVAPEIDSLGVVVIVN